MHSALDDHTRLAYSEILGDETGDSCAGFLARAAAWFVERGVTRIREVMTDNHWSYTKSSLFADVLTAIGATDITIRPHCPWQNVLAETVNELYKTELIYGPDQGPWKTVEEVELATLGWVHWYNHGWLHGYLEDIPPAEAEEAHYAQLTAIR